MRAMLLQGVGKPLCDQRVTIPKPADGEVLIKVRACGVCRTDLHVRDGELPNPKLPLVLGHQIVGTVVALGPGVEGVSERQRVGVPWLGHTCGECRYCRSARENLCDHAEFTGYQRDGGYAEYALADARFVLPLPGSFPDLQVAPRLHANSWVTTSPGRVKA